MGYQHIPVDAIAQGQAMTGGNNNGVMYLDGSGNMATASTFVYSSGLLGVNNASPAALVHIAGAFSSASAFGTTGVGFVSGAATWTDTVTSGTVAMAAVHSLGIPTLAASSASTYTSSATLYIAGATVAGTNVTATNKYSLYIAGGNVGFGALNVVLDTTTGTKIGTSTSQKLGFYNATPVVQQTGDILGALSTLGLVATPTIGAATIGGTQTYGAYNIVLDTTTGTQIGTATSQKLGFLGATPIIQRAGAAQAAVVTTATTQSSPYGFATQAQGDAIVTLVNELRAALVAFGLIKGAA